MNAWPAPSSWMSVPWLSLSILALAVLALVVGRQVDPRRARRVAASGLAAAVVVGLALAGALHFLSQGAPLVDPLFFLTTTPWLYLDELSAVLLPFSALATLAVVLGMPAAQLSPRAARQAVLQVVATWMLFAAADIVVLVAAFALGLLPVWRSSTREGGRSPRIYVVYLATSVALLAAAAVVIVGLAASAGIPAPTSMASLAASSPLLSAGGGDVVALTLLLAAVMLRKGVFPFHSWIPALAEDAGPATVVLVTSPQVAAFLLVRLALPLFPDAMAMMLPYVGRLALVAALYGAVVGLAAQSLRRAYGWLVVSQAALVLVGLESTNVAGMTGGLTLWISIGVALTGLGVATMAVEARRGPGTLDRFGGLDARAPWLGGAFLFLGLASVGLPGTLGFIAEDLLVHGVLEAYPWVGIAVVVATAANAFTVLRAFARVFYGPAPTRSPVADALPRERLALLPLIAVMVVLGALPRPLVATRAEVAQRSLVERGFIGEPREVP